MAGSNEPRTAKLVKAVEVCAQLIFEEDCLGNRECAHVVRVAEPGNKGFDVNSFADMT